MIVRITGLGLVVRRQSQTACAGSSALQALWFLSTAQTFASSGADCCWLLVRLHSPSHAPVSIGAMRVMFFTKLGENTAARAAQRDASV